MDNPQTCQLILFNSCNILKRWFRTLLSFSRNVLGMASNSENQEKIHSKAYHLQPILSTTQKISQSFQLCTSRSVISLITIFAIPESVIQLEVSNYLQLQPW